VELLEFWVNSFVGVNVEIVDLFVITELLLELEFISSLWKETFNKWKNHSLLLRKWKKK
jgi:hypothetical protein